MKTKLAIALLIALLSILPLAAASKQGSNEKTGDRPVAATPQQHMGDWGEQLEANQTVERTAHTPYSIESAEGRLTLGEWADFKDEALRNKIQEYLKGQDPRLEAEFHAMLYPFFRAGINYKVRYQASIGKNQRMDLLLQSYRVCIVIEFKRSDQSVQSALEQAKMYAQDLQNSRYKCSFVCAIGIKLTAKNQVQLLGSYQSYFAYLSYQIIMKDLVDNVNKKFNQIQLILRNR